MCYLTKAIKVFKAEFENGVAVKKMKLKKEVTVTCLIYVFFDGKQ